MPLALRGKDFHKIEPLFFGVLGAIYRLGNFISKHFPKPLSKAVNRHHKTQDKKGRNKKGFLR